MEKVRTTMYVTTKVTIEHVLKDNPLEMTEDIEQALQDMDYDFSYEDPGTGTKIVFTEIMEWK